MSESQIDDCGGTQEGGAARGTPGELSELLGAMRRERERGGDSKVIVVDAQSRFRSIAEEYNRALECARLEIRAREEAVEQARLATDKFRSIFENAVDGIFQTTLEGSYLRVNAALARIYGYASAEQLMNELRNISRQLYVDVERRHQFQAALDQHETVENFESQVYRADGQVIWISENARVVRDEAGQPLYYEGTVVDITGRKEQELLVREAQERAEQANHAKSAFLANMSHEIRTPMTAILGHAEILRQHDLAPECVEAVEIIRRNGVHLLEIINSILDLSKIEAGRLTLNPDAFDLCGLVADVASLMRVKAAAKGLRLDVEFRGPVPERILSDATRLRQILINLLGNGVKFTSAGHVCLSVGLSPDADTLRFEITDTGIGMTEAELSRIFEPFTQADASTTRLFGGTGLGLSISRRLTEMLGGTLEVQSAPGVGTTFTLVVPTGSFAGTRLLTASSEALASANRVERRAQETEIGDVLAGWRILLAEDGADNQRLICHFLRKAGAAMTTVENGELAVERALGALADGEPFDVILMDMQMPVLDGYDAVRRLRRTGYPLPIVAVTAHAMDHDRAECLAAGCDDYVTKPIDRRKLIEVIRNVGRGTAAGCSAGSAE